MCHYNTSYVLEAFDTSREHSPMTCALQPPEVSSHAKPLLSSIASQRALTRVPVKVALGLISNSTGFALANGTATSQIRFDLVLIPGKKQNTTLH